MPLPSGTKIGPYEILAPIGKGGMGEVYEAKDTRLGRSVAIKVLPSEFAFDPERLARFEREAKLLASLNHPNIASVHGFEETNGVKALVLELVEGETLAERIGRGPIPLDEAVAIAKQIAEALEAGHEAGVIHRDLKPSNVKVKDDGRVKVLDYGLAKALEGEGKAGAESELSQSPTLTRQGTEVGVILGTAAYMSPEQAKGKRCDQRADIWAFGALVYEMLTGRRAFAGEDVSDTLAAVLKTEPDWKALPSTTPAELRRILRRCLEKDPRQRMRDAGDVRIELQHLSHSSEDAIHPATAPVRRGRLVALALGAAVMVAALVGSFAFGRRSGAPDRGVVRFEVAPPDGLSLWDSCLGAIAIAPDDRAVAFVAGNGPTRRLYVKALDRPDAQPIAGTENAADPFFSPDGRWVGFFANGKLHKVSTADGTLVEITAAEDSRGASWAPDGTIVFTPGLSSGLVRTSAEGGATRPLTIRDPAAREAGHTWPDVLPDGEHVLYTIEHTGRSFEEASIGVVSLRTGATKVVLRDGSSARYSPSGHLIYARGSRLLAVPFDPGALEVTGEAVTVAEGVAAEIGCGRTHFSISRAGSLAFVPGELNTYARELLWATRDGAVSAAAAEKRGFFGVSLAPDGERLLAILQGADDDLWLFDLSRDVSTRLTFGTENIGPEWSADGRRFLWSSDREGAFNLYLGSLDDPATAERLAPSEREQYDGLWSPDGSQIVYTEFDPATRGDIWAVPMDLERRPRALIRTPFDERLPSVSPDGRWIAYTSDETGRSEVYTQAFPGPGPKRQVSDSRGANTNLPMGGEAIIKRPLRWSRDARELSYWNGNSLMSVPIGPGPELDSGAPRLLFEMNDVVDFDVAPDGRRFLLVRGIAPKLSTRIVVALGGVLEIGEQNP